MPEVDQEWESARVFADVSDGGTAEIAFQGIISETGDGVCVLRYHSLPVPVLEDFEGSRSYVGQVPGRPFRVVMRKREWWLDAIGFGDARRGPVTLFVSAPT